MNEKLTVVSTDERIINQVFSLGPKNQPTEGKNGKILSLFLINTKRTKSKNITFYDYFSKQTAIYSEIRKHCRTACLPKGHLEPLCHKPVFFSVFSSSNMRMVPNIQASAVTITILATVYLCDTGLSGVRHYEHRRTPDVILVSESKVGYLLDLSHFIDQTSFFFF